VFAVLIAFEICLSISRNQKAYDRRDFLGSMSQLAGNIVVQVATRGLLLALYIWLYQFRVSTFPTDIVGLLFLAVVLDIQFYWYRRRQR
jgi:hypothetical protein